MIEAVLQSWKPDPWLVGILLFLSWIYGRGWRHLNRHFPRRFNIGRLVSFYSGLVLFFIATASPLDAFSGLLLTAHMIQHLLLMMLIPPLILLGTPYLPLIRALPRNLRKNVLGPYLRWHGLHQLGRFVTHPLVCLLSFMGTAVIWHLPALYELALRSKSWHDVEHFCFLVTALLFWWPVIQPWPARSLWPRWAMIPYLLVADLQNTAMSAFFIFYDRVIYPSYAAVPRLFGMSVLEDQAAAGSIMWVPGSLAYLIPAGLITIQLLSSKRAAVQPSQLHSVLPTARPPSLRRTQKASAWDLLLVPYIGRVLRHRLFRRAMQTILFALAVGVIIDGLLGPSMSPLNLAGVLPWIHWRGFVVIALLVAGNFFCMACPFMLTRDLGRRFLPARWRWPKALRSKWTAVALLALYLWAYEAFSLWDTPQWTAWIMVGYFVTAFLIDGLFQGASFCKYVCPIGQYNFVQSLVSPLEVKVRSLDVCKTCKTYDCIRGNSFHRGCELQLFQPKKASSLDCTFCLDCVHACPHSNVGILAVVPGSQLFHDRFRSSLGRLSRRADLAALVLLLVFGAFVNAAGMVSPVETWEQGLQHKFGLQSLLPVTTILFLLGLVIVPVLLAIACGEVSRILSGIRIRRKELVCSLALSLIPLGFSMWLVHLLFHLSTGAWTAVPVAQRALLDLGINQFGNPDWMMASASRPFEWLTSLQLVLLDCGLLLSLYVGWRIAQRFTTRPSRTLGVLASWGCLTIFLYVVGVWIIFQPMQMRGMMMH